MRPTDVTSLVREGPTAGRPPCDDHGFIRVDAHGRVAGLEDVNAAGDVTAFGSTR
jgi:hypothetical protein